MTPSVWLPFLTFAWGIVAMCLGFIQNFAGFVAVRAILGFTEGGLLPGMVSCSAPIIASVRLADVTRTRYCTCPTSTEERSWPCGSGCSILRHPSRGPLVVSETRDAEPPSLTCADLANKDSSPTGSPRSATAVASAAGDGSLLSRVSWSVLTMRPVDAPQPLILFQTAVVGLLVYFVLPNGLATAKFLTPEERQFAMARLRAGNGQSSTREKYVPASHAVEMG